MDDIVFIFPYVQRQNDTRPAIAATATNASNEIIPLPRPGNGQSWRNRSEALSTRDPFPIIPTSDLSIYENRLETFKNGWLLTFITPIQMAKAGLYYMGKQDRVRCVLCSTEFDIWKRGVDPFLEHKRISPQCQFFTENQGTYGPAYEEMDRFKNYLKILGVPEKSWVLSHNKPYSFFDSRLETFGNCRIPLKHDIRTLCEAGLYYIGDGNDDKMIAFCCNQGLMDWEYEDDPWVEHARWSPKCSFVLLSKGRYFVDQVVFESNNSIEIQPETDTEEISQIVSVRNLTQENTIPDAMLCKICFKEKLQVLSHPCGHIIACIQCAVTLDECALCTMPFELTLKVNIYINKESDLNPPGSSLSPVSNDNDDSILCKVCRKEEMTIVFIPCTHVASCEGCALKSHSKECPVCFEKYYTYLPVYL